MTNKASPKTCDKIHGDPKPIRVLAISYLFPNKNQPNHGIFVWNRLKALSEYVDITVINPIPRFPLNTMFKRYAALRSIPEFEIYGGLPVYRPKYFSIPGLAKPLEAITYRRAVIQLVKKLEGDRFDLFDLHWTYPDLPAGIALKKLYLKPMLCTLRGMEAFHRNEGKLRETMINHGLKEADSLIALSEELKLTADHITGNSNKSKVVINGVDTTSFRYIPRQKARSQLNIPLDDDLKIILGVGSLIYRKGFDLVIDALPDLKKKFPKLKYYVLGSEGPEGDYRNELKTKIKNLQLEDTVVFYGAVANSQLSSWYNACDVFCLSSRGEGSPNVLSEALATGTLCVSTSVGSASDLMKQAEQASYICDSITAKSLQDRLAQALSCHSSFDREASSKNYQQFNWDWCARQVLGEYRHLLIRPFNTTTTLKTR